MSKKDYQAIARVINTALVSGNVTKTDVLLRGLVDVFAQGNPRFDRDRFLEACETGHCKGMRKLANG